MVSKTIVAFFVVFAVTFFVAEIYFNYEASLFQNNDYDGIIPSQSCIGLLDQWNDYKLEYEHAIKNSGKTYQEMFDNFCKNMKLNSKIRSNPNDKDAAIFGANELSILSPKEFKETRLNLAILNSYQKLKSSGVPDEPKLGASTSVDWKDQVTPVRNQGGCGSCWAFACIGALEALYRIENRGVADIDFSEQQYVDCTRRYQTFGCQGGWPHQALRFSIDVGISLERNYQYTAADGNCKNTPIQYKIKDVLTISDGNVQTLANALNRSPVTVCIDAAQWGGYKGGIFRSSQCGTKLSHAVLLTAYDSESWKIKNSWGDYWGEQGYIRLERGNTCGIANAAAQPIGFGVPDPNPPTPTPNQCEDLNANCAGWARNGECSKNPAYMNPNCKKSCGLCGNTPNPTPDDDPNCRDMSSACNYLVSQGECSKNEADMRKNCYKSCRFCTPKPNPNPNPQPTCVDYDINCPGWRPYCGDRRYAVDQKCPKSCGLCR